MEPASVIETEFSEYQSDFLPLKYTGIGSSSHECHTTWTPQDLGKPNDLCILFHSSGSRCHQIDNPSTLSSLAIFIYESRLWVQNKIITKIGASTESWTLNEVSLAGLKVQSLTVRTYSHKMVLVTGFEPAFPCLRGRSINRSSHTSINRLGFYSMYWIGFICCSQPKW